MAIKPGKTNDIKIVIKSTKAAINCFFLRLRKRILSLKEAIMPMLLEAQME